MISIIILTKNNEKTIEQTLNSTKKFSEVLIIDTGSCDRTLKKAENFKNVKIIKNFLNSKNQTLREFGFGNFRNEGAKFAKNDWILALDSDEVITQKLTQEILKEISLKENFVYSIPFLNYYNEKLIKCCGWHKRSHIRLYNRKNTSFDSSYIHEGILVNKNLKVKKLKNHIKHFPFFCIDDFLKKIEKYSSLFAKNHSYTPSLLKAIFHGFFSFFKSYIIKKGIFYKKEGFIISLYNANCTFYKYLKLLEKQEK
jgi:glycosyltransferase involved in cell wall biosynthesis